MSRTVLVLALAVLMLPFASLATGAGSLSFTQTRVAPFVQSGEPLIVADARTTPYSLYVTEPNFGNEVYRSLDDGVTWTQRPPTLGGGGDADLAIDADGTMYASDLLSPTATLSTTLPVSTSVNGGNSWARMLQLDPGAGTGVAWDRQWMVADGHGHVVVTARSGSNDFKSWVSRDGAITFSGPNLIASSVTKTGRIIVVPNGTLYAPYSAGSVMFLAASTDGGTSWTSHPVATNTFAASLHFPGVAVDAAGNLYLAWATDTQNAFVSGLYAQKTQVFFSKSADGGSTWSPRVQLSDTANNAIFPWIVAGSAGKVDVAWYAENFNYYPDIGTPVTTWDVVVAQSLDAASAAPTWTRTVAVPAFHTGSICTGGLTLCPGPQQQYVGNAPTPFDRRDLDFFGMVKDANGNAIITYPKDRPITSSTSDIVSVRLDLMVARQTGGSTIN